MLSLKSLPSVTVAPSVAVVSATTATSRPVNFHQHYIAARPVPYHFVESTLRPSSSGGVLREGQAVWLEQVIWRTRLAAHVRAFVENIGLVSLDPRLIKKGDASVSSLG